MAQLTDKGFIPKTQNEYFEEQRNLLKGIDPDWNLDPSTPDGLKIAKDAEVFGNLDEAIQAAYNSKDPAKAEDNDLDIICSLTGTKRDLGTPSVVDIEMTGNVGTLIPQGSVIDSGVNTPQWETDADYIVGAGGTITGTATCIDNGQTEASIGQIIRIVSTIGGWLRVTNTAVPTLGTNPQTDAELRIERELSVSRPGNAMSDAMLGELYATTGVRHARIYNNRTDSDAVDPVNNPHGLPKKSITILVDGGDDADVAKAIFIKNNPGPLMHGAGTPVVVPNVYNLYPTNAETITFGRPTGIDQVIVIDITNDGSLPANAADLIKDAIISYTDGTLINQDVGFNFRGYSIFQPVPVQQMYTPVNKVIGSFGYSYVTNLTVNGLSTGLSPITFEQIARFSSANITVNIT